MLRVRMLGGFGADRAGRPVRFSTRKVAALLALLALRPGAVVPRARLAAMLWPESGEGAARTSLLSVADRLRSACGRHPASLPGPRARLSDWEPPAPSIVSLNS